MWAAAVGQRAALREVEVLVAPGAHVVVLEQTEVDKEERLPGPWLIGILEVLQMLLRRAFSDSWQGEVCSSIISRKCIATQGHSTCSTDGSTI